MAWTRRNSTLREAPTRKSSLLNYRIWWVHTQRQGRKFIPSFAKPYRKLWGEVTYLMLCPVFWQTLCIWRISTSGSVTGVSHTRLKESSPSSWDTWKKFGIPRRLVLVPERFFGRKKGYLILSTFPPRPQHLAEGLLEHTVIGGLIDWYLQILGTVPIFSMNIRTCTWYRYTGLYR